jgi:hypothetical protein
MEATAPPGASSCGRHGMIRTALILCGRVDGALSSWCLSVLVITKHATHKLVTSATFTLAASPISRAAPTMHVMCLYTYLGYMLMAYSLCIASRPRNLIAISLCAVTASAEYNQPLRARLARIYSPSILLLHKACRKLVQTVSC